MANKLCTKTTTTHPHTVHEGPCPFRFEEVRARGLTPMLECRECGCEVDPLAIFPGNRCLTCYRPIGEAQARTMTADDLTAMWGGKRRGR